MIEYSVLAGPVETELEIKRSVFLTRLVRVTCEDEAREVIAQARHDGHNARHHVSAFVPVSYTHLTLPTILLV